MFLMRVFAITATLMTELEALVVVMVVVQRALTVANLLQKTCYHPAVANWKPSHGRSASSR
jgi:hypothetical protein